MRCQLALLATACVMASPALAQSQNAMNAAEAGKARAADAALNAQYAATMRRLSAPSQALLRAAQRSWLTFRDQECRFETSGVQGGSAYPMVNAMCMAKLTTERTRQLRYHATCQEGDMSCPR